MTLTHLRFQAVDILNSALVAPDGVNEFTISTAPSYYIYKQTIIVALSGVRGLVNWHKKTFAIGGVERPWAELKKHTGNPLSSKFRIWHWSDLHYTVRYARDPDGEMRYTVRYTREDGKWLREPEAAVTDLARLSPIVSHFFQGPENATLYLSPKLEESERMFLLLVLVTSETRQRDNV
ncbi:hypothetical protein DFH07DRAFT_979433 [Mycena maculata]|uniref:Uncharacterized protein n=1 Tax=Mycena maculata TaxID=230809 RepID=A0AAD7N468_9AGAR|nr:hypothetical protein DFH07DRAFT_979433 [Mycena maculata]